MLALTLALVQTAQLLSVADDSLRPEQEILHYRIAVELPDTGRTIRASAAVRYVMVEGGGPLRLDFDSVFAIDSIVGAAGKIPAAQRSGTAQGWRLVKSSGGGWLLLVPVAGSPGDTSEVTVYYRGRPRDGLIVGSNRHGRRVVFADNWPNRARHWFPGEDHPSDKATAEFSVEVPSGWRAVANGALVGLDTLEGGRTRWRWAISRPIPTYTMVIGAASLSVAALGTTDGIAQTLWVYAEDSAFAVTGPFRRVGKMLEVYSRLIGPFPYEKLAHVESSTRFGGMENSTAIFYAESGFRDQSLSEETVAHEIAHQWFGDAVTPGDWHHLWLSEGFASYLGPMFFEQVGEVPRFREAMERNRRVYFLSDVVDRPIIDTAQKVLLDLLNANTYPKAAWVLHMLRAELGDSVFLAGLRGYYRRFRDSSVLSADFQRVMEEVSGRSLGWFFEQWLLQPGYPRLSAEWAYRDGSLVLRVRQMQEERWGSFALRLPVRVEFEGGGAEEFVVRVSGWQSEVERRLRDRPVRVWLDPGGTLLMEVVELSERR
ncbi:Aminopeptidase N [bacterium HR33]|nr:Aminopeptidase N [bacterium HR33]